jgi:hypothetical protein
MQRKIFDRSILEKAAAWWAEYLPGEVKFIETKQNNKLSEERLSFLSAKSGEQALTKLTEEELIDMRNFVARLCNKDGQIISQQIFKPGEVLSINSKPRFLNSQGFSEENKHESKTSQLHM